MATAARRELEIALRLDPECMSARIARALLTGAAGKPDEARKLIMNTLGGLGATSNKRVAQFIGSLTNRWYL